MNRRWSVTSTNIIAMAKKNETKYNNLFEQLYAEGPDALKELDADLVRGTVKRGLESAYDSARLQMMAKRKELNRERANVDALDINAIVEIHKDIADLEASCEYIALEYSKLFGEELPAHAKLLAEA